MGEKERRKGRIALEIFRKTEGENDLVRMNNLFRDMRECKVIKFRNNLYNYRGIP